MKKKIAIVTCAVMIVALVLTLTACSNPTGTYKLKSISVKSGDTTATIKTGEDYNGITLSEDTYVLELKSDNTCVMTSKLGILQTKSNGTWKINADNKNQVDITFDDSTETVDFSASEIKMTYGGLEITLEKK